MAYREPDRSRCEIDPDWHFPLQGPPDRFSLHVELWFYRGRIVRFALMLWQDDPPINVARIDTCHGTVHRHSLGKDGSEDIHQYEEIPEKDGWDFVTAAYTRYYDLVVAEWPEWVRRWNG